MNVAPSDQQFVIVAGPHRVTLVKGGGVRSYTHHGRAVLDGYPAEAMCTGARGTPLIPWPNRLADGTYTYAGTDYQVVLTEPETHNAIHGFLRWHNWTVRKRETDRVILDPPPDRRHRIDYAFTDLAARGRQAGLGPPQRPQRAARRVVD